MDGVDEGWSQPKSRKKKVQGEAPGTNPPAGPHIPIATPLWRSAPLGRASGSQAGTTSATT